MDLQEIAQIFDCPHSTAPDEGEGYALIRTPNVGKGRLLLDGVHRVSKEAYLKRNKRATPQEGDIIFAREAPAGNAAVITKGQKVCLGQRTVLIRPNSDLTDSVYLTYYLLSPEQQIRLLGLTHGSTVGHVNIPDLAKLICKLPTLPIQRKIASILSTYDNLLENNTKRIKLLEQMAENLYKEWFVRFRFPGHWDVEMENGLPKGWKEIVASSAIDVMSGGTPKTEREDFYGGNIPFYTPKDADDSIFVYNTLTNITEEGLAHCNSQYYPVNTLMITARGTVGKLSLLAVPMAMNQSCFALQFKTKDNPYYLYYAIKTEVARLKKMANGGVFDTIIVKTFDYIKLVMPPNNLLDSFNTIVAPMLEQIKKLTEQNSLLARQRALLLPRLMSGKLEVTVR